MIRKILAPTIVLAGSLAVGFIAYALILEAAGHIGIQAQPNWQGILGTTACAAIWAVCYIVRNPEAMED